MSPPALRRRSFLALAGAAATAGCAALPGDDGPRHVKDAPVAERVPDGPWPTLYRDARNASHAPGLAGPGPDARVEPVAGAGRYFGMAPAVGPDRLYFGVDRLAADDGRWSGFRAVDRRTGAEAWRAPEELGMAAPTVYRNAVFATAAGTTRAFDRRDGSRCWSYPAGTGHDQAGPATDGGTVYVAGADRVHAVDARTGERAWRADPVDGAVQGVALARGRVCATVGAGAGGTLVAYLPGTGGRAWRFDRLGESYAPPVVDDERAYAVNTAGVLYAVSLDDGTEQWRFGFRRPSYVPPAVADGTVYLAGTNSDVLHAFDAATGEERWTYPTGVGRTTPPVVLDGTVYVGSGRTLSALDAATGEERWTLALGRDVGTPLAPGDGVVYFGTTDAHPQDRVYAVREP